MYKEIWKILEKYRKNNECFFPPGGAAIQVQGNREILEKFKKKMNTFFC